MHELIYISKRFLKIITGDNRCLAIVKDYSSPPRSSFSPASLLVETRFPLLRLGLPSGGNNESKFNLRRASFAARGVLAKLGVLLPKFAGLGVTLTKSAKLNGCPGVLNPAMKPPAPGVDIIEDGRTCVFDGGVEGAKTLDFAPGFAGDGDVAR